MALVMRFSGISGRGVTDFVLQRVTAVILTLYTALVVGFFAVNQVDYQTFEAFPRVSKSFKPAAPRLRLAKINMLHFASLHLRNFYLQQ